MNVEPGLPEASFADRALEQLRRWTALEVLGAGRGGGAVLAVQSRQIVRLHPDDEAELRLTWPVIQRLSAALAEGDKLRFAPGSDWIRLWLGCDSDVRMLMLLASVANQANGKIAHEQRAT